MRPTAVIRQEHKSHETLLDFASSAQLYYRPVYRDTREEFGFIRQIVSIEEWVVSLPGARGPFCTLIVPISTYLINTITPGGKEFVMLNL